MKRLIYINALFIVGCLWMGCPSVYGQAPVKKNSFKDVRESFKSPDHHYGSAPLWVWNTVITTGKIDSMLQDFKDKAFGGVIIHPRPGLITPYLSDEWQKCYAYAVAKGKSLGLSVWIYDENSYPSGFAGGHVPAEMPSSYNQGQSLLLSKADVLPADVSVYAVILKKAGEGFVDISQDASGDVGKKGTYYLFKKGFYGRSPWFAGYSYVDLMQKGVTEKFIDITMRGYQRDFGQEFGRTVMGVFSDEPNIEPPGGIRWTPDLFTVFKDRWGYSLIDHLPSLFEEVGDWKRVRHNYFQVLLQLFIDRWSKPWNAYTEKNHLEWTGHYWEHAWPNPAYGGDNMAMYAWHQRPAIDMLFNQFDETSPNAQFGNIRSVKELASVANQLSKQRTLSETYGGGGWELTLTDMKRLGDWEFVLGVNTMDQHLAHMTLQGARKYDYPQSFSYQNPVWPYYTDQNRYFARLSLALSSGKQVNNTLILEPTTSAWMYAGSRRMGDIGKQFQGFITRLERAQAEYDLGSENIIKDHGRLDKDRFTVGDASYQLVVVPPGMENIDRSTFDLLYRFAAAGGKVLLFEDLRYIDGAPQEALVGKLKACQHVQLYDALSDALIKKYFLDDRLVFEGDSLVQPSLYHHVRQLKDGRLLFLVNSDLTGEKRVRLKAKAKQVLLMDAENGQMYEFPATDGNGSFRSFSYKLPAAGSALFYLADVPQSGLPAWKAMPDSGKVVDAGPGIAQRLGPNVLTVDFCDLHLGDTVLRDLHTFYAADTVFKQHGFRDGNPWNTSVQFKDETIKRDTFSVGSGFMADYHFQIRDASAAKGLQAVVEHPELWEVSVNGVVVRQTPGKWWLDRDFAVFDVGDKAHVGDNVLRLDAKRMSVYAEIEPVYLLGNFALQAMTKGWAIGAEAGLKIGSWKSQGMPFYGHEVAYQKKFTGHRGKSYLVGLGNWKGTAAVVKLNGKTVGNIQYPPNKVLLDTGIQEGENVVEIVVVGSLKNTLGPFHNKPVPGMVGPGHWRNVHKYPPGADYDQYDYGLMEDFKIWER